MLILKRIICLILAVAAVLGICGCGIMKKGSAFDQGVSAYVVSDYEEAVAKLKQAVSEDPGNVDAYLFLADAYEALGRHENALSTLEKGMKSTGDERFSEKLAELNGSAETTDGQTAQAETSAKQNESADTVFDQMQRGFSCLSDDEMLLGDGEYLELKKKLEELSGECGNDIVIFTVLSFDGKTAQDFADDAYDDFNMGQGENRDGVLLVISTAESEFYITTCGAAIDALDDVMDELCDGLTERLSRGKYYDAFNYFADTCAEYLR